MQNSPALILGERPHLPGVVFGKASEKLTTAMLKRMLDTGISSVRVAEDADVADPGKIAEAQAAQSQSKAGKYGSQKVEPHVASEEDSEDEEKTWIEIELVDEEDNPVPGEKYKITLPDGKVAQGTLDGKGFARVDYRSSKLPDSFYQDAMSRYSKKVLDGYRQELIQRIELIPKAEDGYVDCLNKCDYEDDESSYGSELICLDN